MSTWIPVLAAIIVPGSGYVYLKKPKRGLMMLFWMIIFGFITYQLTTVNISMIGRYSGGIAVWVISILEVYRITKKRAHS